MAWTPAQRLTVPHAGRRQILGTDSETGEVCGTGGQAGRPHQYLANPADPVGRRLCLAACPANFSKSAQVRLSFLPWLPSQSMQDCRDNRRNWARTRVGRSRHGPVHVFKSRAGACGAARQEAVDLGAYDGNPSTIWLEVPADPAPARAVPSARRRRARSIEPRHVMDFSSLRQMQLGCGLAVSHTSCPYHSVPILIHFESSMIS